MTVTFAIAKRADLPRIVEIYNQAVPTFTATADIKPVTVSERAGWFANHNPKRRPIWLIKKENEVVGWLSLSDYYDRFAYYPTVEISIYIDQAHHHEHLAQKAVSYAERQAPKFGIMNIAALIFAHNQASLGLFKKLNYQQWGHLPDVCELNGKLRSVDILGKKVASVEVLKLHKAS